MSVYVLVATVEHQDSEVLCYAESPEALRAVLARLQRRLDEGNDRLKRWRQRYEEEVGFSPRRADYGARADETYARHLEFWLDEHKRWHAANPKPPALLHTEFNIIEVPRYFAFDTHTYPLEVE